MKSVDMFVRTKEDALFRKFLGITLKNIIMNVWDLPDFVSSPTKSVLPI